MVLVLKRPRLWWPVGIGLALGVVLGGVALLVDERHQDNAEFLRAAAAASAGGIVLGLAGYGLHNPNRGDDSRLAQAARASRGVLEKQQADHVAQLQEKLNEALRTSMLLMAGADGEVDEEELTSIIGIYEQVTDTRLPPEVLRAEAARLSDRAGAVHAQLQDLAPHLELAGKAMFIRAVVVVAAADGRFDDREWQTVATIGQALAMSVPELKSVIDAAFTQSG